MKIHIIARRLVLAIIPSTLAVKLGKGKPRRNEHKYETEIYQLIEKLENQNKKIIDFGCGDMRIGDGKDWDVRYVDNKRNLNIDGKVDARSLEALYQYSKEEIKFDALLAISSLQYLSRNSLLQFYQLTETLLKPSKGYLMIEIDNRDLMSGIDNSGGALYINEYDWIARKLNGSLVEILADLNLFVNCISINNHLEIMKGLKIFPFSIQINMTTTDNNWEEVEKVPSECLRARIKAKKYE